MVIESQRPAIALDKTPEYFNFEGVDIQWNKANWNFDHPQKGVVAVDTYSVWNTEHHDEITERLKNGQRCALYMMGTFGVAEVRGQRGFRKADDIFEKIKQRDKMQSLVVFAHPEDIGEYIDVERLPLGHQSLKNGKDRYDLYAGPMHAIFPINENTIPDLGFIRAEKTASFFWIPNHYGYEELYKNMKGKIEDGVMAGGSLNIHKQEPSYTREQLRNEMSKHEEWLDGVHFVIFDEISEAENIGRSHTQVSFETDPPKVVRIGSLPVGKIAEHTGRDISYDLGVKEASSTTAYTEEFNSQVAQKVQNAFDRIKRFQSFLTN